MPRCKSEEFVTKTAQFSPAWEEPTKFGVHAGTRNSHDGPENLDQAHPFYREENFVSQISMNVFHFFPHWKRTQPKKCGHEHERSVFSHKT